MTMVQVYITLCWSLCDLHSLKLRLSVCKSHRVLHLVIQPIVVYVFFVIHEYNAILLYSYRVQIIGLGDTIVMEKEL